MPHAILDTGEYPDVPLQGPVNTQLNIPSNPGMFGAFSAQAAQNVGASVDKAADAGMDVLTAKQHLTNEIHAGELNSWLADKLTDEYSNFSQLRGRAAQEALPQFKQKIEDLRQQSISQAGNLQTQALVSNANRFLADKFYSYGTGHADKEFHVWQDQTVKDRASNFAGVAAISAQHGDFPGMETALGTSDDEVRKLFEQNSGDYGPVSDQESIDRAVKANRSHNVRTIVEGQTDIDPGMAALIFKKYQGQMEPADRLSALNKLKTQSVKLDAIDRVDRDYPLPNPPVNQGQLDNIGARYGISGEYLARTHQIEGNGTSSTGAQGPFQFTRTTAARYNLDDPFNFAKSADAAARLAADNKASMTANLGRAPSDAELYLAHQQGAAGASFLLRNPNAPAAVALAPAYGGNLQKAAHAIAVNGGDPTAPASVFTNKFINLYNGKNSAVTVNEGVNYLQDSKGAAMQRILDDPELKQNPPLRDAMLTELNKRYTAQQADYLNQERQHQVQQWKAQQDQKQAEDELLTGVINNDPTWNAQRVMSDPRFGNNREHALAILQSKVSGTGDAATYGQDFYKLFNQIHSAPGTPDHINSDAELLPHLGHGITLSGLDKLRGEINGKGTADGESMAAMQKQFLANAKKQISGKDPILHIEDPKGEELFLKFLPAYYQAKKKAIADGKTPAQMYDPDSADYLGKNIGQFKRTPQQQYADMMAGTNGDTATPGPTAPIKVDEKTVTQPQLILMVHNNQIPRADAERIALAKGWIRPNAPPVPQIPLSQ